MGDTVGAGAGGRERAAQEHINAQLEYLQPGQVLMWPIIKLYVQSTILGLSSLV